MLPGLTSLIGAIPPPSPRHHPVVLVRLQVLSLVLIQQRSLGTGSWLLKAAVAFHNAALHEHRCMAGAAPVGEVRGLMQRASTPAFSPGRPYATSSSVLRIVSALKRCKATRRVSHVAASGREQGGEFASHGCAPLMRCAWAECVPGSSLPDVILLGAKRLTFP